MGGARDHDYQIALNFIYENQSFLALQINCLKNNFSPSREMDFELLEPSLFCIKVSSRGQRIVLSSSRPRLAESVSRKRIAIYFLRSQGILILDQDGERIFAKYYNPPESLTTPKGQKDFEKMLHKKTNDANAGDCLAYSVYIRRS